MKRAKRQSLDYGAEQHPTVSRTVARFSLLGGGIAWTLHLLSVYIISEFGCRAGWGHAADGELSRVAWLLLIATALTGLLAAVATYASFCASKLLKGSEGDRAVVTTENKYFIARVSMVLNALFTFIILIQGIPVFYFLRKC